MEMRQDSAGRVIHSPEQINAPPFGTRSATKEYFFGRVLGDRSEKAARRRSARALAATFHLAITLEILHLQRERRMHTGSANCEMSQT